MIDQIQQLRATRLALVLALTSLAANPFCLAQTPGRVQDLQTPTVTGGEPAAGKRVRQVLPAYRGSDVYHLLYLPSDWQPGQKYPVIVEYAGNKYQTSPGTVEGSNLGYGISGGKGAIWVCMPYVDSKEQRNQTRWWGDVDATVAYCKETVALVCDRFGGDAENVFIAGFSRGAIAGNFIGLYDDQIASLWRGFICHSHYDGVKQWAYAGSDRLSAAKRLSRLGDRAQFISHEKSVDPTRDYLADVMPQGNFTFQVLAGWDHTDTWVLYDIPERTTLREWFNATCQETR
ncbi:hypothetical protein Mal15_23980 [Stieleria maiorica]|uniref:Uncharacterized protein n=1 Tax=Stieleria maiorica TaxID=2795974 RepID=A0A5B9MDN2_9BACT|nr:hypothetical protein [Stieleria maiorica]QEF98346.1 hypothetical protein Mal15_23980 [Stieleria maiorica]